MSCSCHKTLSESLTETILWVVIGAAFIGLNIGIIYLTTIDMILGCVLGGIEMFFLLWFSIHNTSDYL